MSEGTCRCGRPLITRPGDIEPTCAECRGKLDACVCPKLAARRKRRTRRDTAKTATPARPLPAPTADPAGLLGELRDWLCSYVAFASAHHAVAVALWVVHTHLVAAFDSTPRLAVLSPERECGKTRVLELAELVGAGAEILSGASPAYLFRRIGTEGAGPVTLLLDEADTIWKRGKSDESAEALRSIVDAGHRKGATVGRVEMNGQGANLVRFPVYAPAAIAAIGTLPDTIMSRAVVIHMRRRAPGQQVRPYRERITRPEGEALRDKLAAWAVSVADKVGDPWPDMPTGVEDRAADAWEPLLMVADLAGGDWPPLARDACAALVVGARDDDDIQTSGTRLLADLLEVFGDAAALSTETILSRLRALDEAPWADWYGHPLTARDLARLLGHYRAADDRPVKPRVVRIGVGTARGYRREDLADAWARYLPARGGVTDVTSVTPLARDVTEVTSVTHTQAEDPGPLWDDDGDPDDEPEDPDDWDAPF